MKKLLLFTTIGLVACYGIITSHDSDALVNKTESTESSTEEKNNKPKLIIHNIPQGIAGNYLISRHAQSSHDWETAEKHLSKNIKKDKNNLTLQNQAMVMAMGAGKYERSFQLAEQIIRTQTNNELANIFLSIKYVKAKEYQKAIEQIEMAAPKTIASFIEPTIKSWAYAGINQLEIDNLLHSSSTIYHAAIITTYLKQLDKWDTKYKIAKKSNISSYDKERIADYFAKNGYAERAYPLYEEIIKVHPQYGDGLRRKASLIKTGNLKLIKDINVNSPSQGISLALYDISLMLYDEDGFDSARLFTSMALYLTPSKSELKILISSISSDNNQIDSALSYLNSIKKDHDLHVEAQKFAAEILSSNDRHDESIEILQNLVKDYGDLKAQIMIGDLKREQKKYQQSLIEYNKAFKMSDNVEPYKLWHLYFYRGIAYERLKNWKMAEKDFQQALSFQPNNPFILNYLGYSWADQGHQLDKSLEMLKKAKRLSPNDGFIADSLGWVLYKMNKFEESIPHLEKAVELEPYEPIINDHLGDAYWNTGRKLEAQFQWKRALNYADEELDTDLVKNKIKDGLTSVNLKKAEINNNNN